MKLSPLIAVWVSLFTAGCFMAPSPYADRLNPIARRYSSVEKGLARSHLQAELGAPAREEEDGACVWETCCDDLNYARLKVWFNQRDQVEKLEITRAHGQRAPGYHATAVTTRSS